MYWNIGIKGYPVFYNSWPRVYIMGIHLKTFANFMIESKYKSIVPQYALYCGTIRYCDMQLFFILVLNVKYFLSLQKHLQQVVVSGFFFGDDSAKSLKCDEWTNEHKNTKVLIEIVIQNLTGNGKDNKVLCKVCRYLYFHYDLHELCFGALTCFFYQKNGQTEGYLDIQCE